MARRAAATTEAAVAAVAAFAVLVAACGGGAKEGGGAPVGVSSAPGPAVAQGPVSFQYDSLDARPVASDAFRGKPTVLAFVTTWDVTSQAQIDFLVIMSKRDQGRVNYAMIALEDVRERELVEVYAQKLGVEFPVALGDKETIAGRGPFGDVHNVPTVVVLDRRGGVAWLKVGLAKSDEIRAALARL